MQTFDVKPETIRKPKTCACCKNTIAPPEKMYHGHSTFKTENDCSSYICSVCAENVAGYVIECFCGEY